MQICLFQSGPWIYRGLPWRLGWRFIVPASSGIMGRTVCAPGEKRGKRDGLLSSVGSPSRNSTPTTGVVDSIAVIDAN
jgi:hypothetical protein